MRRFVALACSGGKFHPVGVIVNGMSKRPVLIAPMDTQPQPVTRATVEAFYRAYATRDPAKIGPMLDENIDWILSGPVDVMPYCGSRRGRAHVLEIFDGHMPLTFKNMAIVPQAILTDGDRAAMIGTFSAVVAKTGQKAAYRIGHFMRFRNGRIVEFRGIIDTFDAAEQILGHPIDVSRDDPDESESKGKGRLIAV